MEPGDFAQITRMRRKLREWYARHARPLPWRKTTDPYRVWISEIMLQQTTVAAVVPFYTQFLDRFPTVHELAAADESEVLRQWEGLGYYRRARNLHQTARRIVDEHGGMFPADVAALTSLPGIGRYTAGAIISFAFDRPAPILEANTLRLYCRLLAYAGDPRSAAGQRDLWEFAGRLVPRRSPGRFNQALMELGATVCLPQEPDCPACPVRFGCRAFARGAPGAFPRPGVRPKTESVTEAAVAVCAAGAVLLRRCPPGERWAGLWDFPRVPLDDFLPGDHSGHKEGRPVSLSRKLCRRIETRIQDLIGTEVLIQAMLTQIRHSVTRYRIRLLCLRAAYRGGGRKQPDVLRWVRPEEFDSVPLSVTGRRFARLLANLWIDE